MISLANKMLLESYVNLIDDSNKLKYIDQVWEILQDSYASQGGIKGKGFSNKQDMIENIQFWKLFTKNDIVYCCVLYKFKDGIRKTVALGINRDPEHINVSRKYMHQMLKQEFTRSLMEVSGQLVQYLKKNFKDLVYKYSIPVEKVSGIINKEITPIDSFLYSRNINGHEEVKQLIGTINKKY